MGETGNRAGAEGLESLGGPGWDWLQRVETYSHSVCVKRANLCISLLPDLCGTSLQPREPRNGSHDAGKSCPRKASTDFRPQLSTLNSPFFLDLCLTFRRCPPAISHHNKLLYTRTQQPEQSTGLFSGPVNLFLMRPKWRQIVAAFSARRVGSGLPDFQIHTRYKRKYFVETAFLRSHLVTTHQLNKRVSCNVPVSL